MCTVVYADGPAHRGAYSARGARADVVVVPGRGYICSGLHRLGDHVTAWARELVCVDHMGGPERRACFEPAETVDVGLVHARRSKRGRTRLAFQHGAGDLARACAFAARTCGLPDAAFRAMFVQPEADHLMANPLDLLALGPVRVQRATLWTRVDGQWVPWSRAAARRQLEGLLAGMLHRIPPGACPVRLPVPGAFDIRPKEFARRDKYGARWFRGGAGVQNAMFAHADRCGHAFFAVDGDTHTREKWYGSYPDCAAFLEHYPHAWPDGARHVYEIARAGRAVCLFVDVDMYQDERDTRAGRDTLATITAAISRTLEDMDVPACDDWIVSCGSRADRGKWKESYHASLASVFFVNMDALKSFMQSVHAFLQEDTLDMNVYTRNRCMRLPFSAKGKSPQCPMLLDDGARLRDALLTRSPDPAASTVVAQAEAPRAPRAPDSGVSVSGPQDIPSGLYKQLTGLVRRAGDRTSRVSHELSRGGPMRMFCGRNDGMPRTCPSGFEHNSNNYFLEMDMLGYVSYVCHRSTKKCSHVRVPIGSVDLAKV